MGCGSCYQRSPQSALPVARKSLGITKFFLAVNEVSESIIVFYCCSTDRHDTSLKIINTFFEKKFGYEGWNFNLLKPNDIYKYICRTAALTSRRYILNIYSTNIHTEYFKQAA